jgi:hypothetical protein
MSVSLATKVSLELIELPLTRVNANLAAATAEVTALTAPGSGDYLLAPPARSTSASCAGPPSAGAQLTDRASDFDGVVLTDNEFDRRRLTAGLTECTTYLAELATRKDALSS